MVLGLLAFNSEFENNIFSLVSMNINSKRLGKLDDPLLWRT